MKLRDYMTGDEHLINIRDQNKLAYSSAAAEISRFATTMVSEDGDPIAICGVVHQDDGVGSIWVMCSDEVRGHGKAIVRSGKELCSIWMDKFKYHRLQAIVKMGNEEDKKFAVLCGFKLEGVMRKATPDQMDVELYALVK